MLQLIPASASAEDTAAVTPTASSDECTVKMIWRYSSELRRPSDCAAAFGTTRVRPSGSRKLISGVHVNAPGISRATQKTHLPSVNFGESFRRISARSVAGVTVCDFASRDELIEITAVGASVLRANVAHQRAVRRH